MHVGRRIRDARVRAGISQEDAVSKYRERAGSRTSVSTWQRWERTGRLQADELAIVSLVLDADALELLGLGDAPPTNDGAGSAQREAP